MMKLFSAIIGILLSLKGYSQALCDNFPLKKDSCVMLVPNKKEWVDVMEVKIKNNYLVQFIRQGQNTFLKIIVRDDLGFGKTGSLLLLSGKKQYFVKEIRLDTDQASGYFILDVYPQYLRTIKDNGMTSFIFREKTEFTIPKSDSELIKKAAACFMEQIMPK